MTFTRLQIVYFAPFAEHWTRLTAFWLGAELSADLVRMKFSSNHIVLD